MTAKRLTKSERAAKRKRKEDKARQDKRKPLTPLDIWAIYVTEARAALIRQGMTPEQAMDYITSVFHTPRIPDWSHVNPDHSPYEDDDDEDE